MPRNLLSFWPGLAMGLLAVRLPLSAVALEPSTPLAEYARQGWVMENGLPQNSVHALVQTRDGFLWLGTEAGLVRFDGVSFLVLDHASTPALPSGDIRYLLVGKDDALWVGTSEGLVRLRDGVVTPFAGGAGPPPDAFASPNEIAESRARAALRGEAPFPWLAKGEAAARVRLAGGGSAEATRDAVAIARGARQNILAVARDLPGTRVQAILADREGALWIGTNGGLARWVEGRTDRFPVNDVLATASILALLEDREGNLWVGTETGGLHILRNTRFRSIGTHEGLSSDATTAVVEDAQGTLWVGTAGAGLDALGANGAGRGAKTYTVREGLPSDVVLSLAAAPDGELWVGTPDGLSRIRGGRVESYTSADGLPDDFVRSLLVDGDGSLWIGTRHGLTHWARPPAPKHMETYTQAAGLGSDLVGALARDGHGNLWVATLAGLSRLAENRITNYTTRDGLSSDVVTALLPRKNGTLWVGTQDHGWAMWNGSTFSSVRDPARRETGVHAILDDGLNHLWFATSSGIARCDATASVDCAHWLEFGPADGLRSRETATNSHPSAWRARDGHLWFATPKGLVEVDPAHFPVNALPPQVAIERFAADDVDQPLAAAGSGLKVAAGHNHFQFDYAGLSFVAPQKVHYRYMLDAFDHDWADAGSRRVAYYTNIPPGDYTFRVQAANNDGVWNLEGATLRFELEPHFYQTLWFYLLLTLALAGLVALAVRGRLLAAEREFNAVLGERNRIAREIHDTLAQGYVGISVQLELLSELLRQHKVEQAAQQLDVTRGHVREGLQEARQSIWALRSQDAGENTLPVSLRRLAEQAGSGDLEATFSVHGAYRPLSPPTEREIVRVAQEAIHNVVKHAAARHLSVQLSYGPSDTALEVRDDGRGFEPQGQQAAAHGHFGLTGMRERAAAIGGSLEVVSATGAGTTLRLNTPAPREVV